MRAFVFRGLQPVAEFHPALFVSWQRGKPVVKQELLRSWWILSPTSRPHVDVGTAHGSPLDSSLWVSQEEFQFASTTMPTGWLIRGPNNGCPRRVAVRDLCVAYRWRSTTNHSAVGHNGKWQPPNRSNSIAEQTQSISSPHLIGGRVVARRDNRAEYGFYLGQGNVPCSGSVLMCGTRGKK
jgi:hypothetical protein